MNDVELIAKLGGPTRVAQLLALKKHGAQRVQNWLYRGIPAKVKLDHPHIFLLDIFKQENGVDALSPACTNGGVTPAPTACVCAPAAAQQQSGAFCNP